MNEGSWNNVAVSRDGSNNFEIFVNGTKVGAVASNSTALNAKTSGNFLIRWSYDVYLLKDKRNFNSYYCSWNIQFICNIELKESYEGGVDF